MSRSISSSKPTPVLLVGNTGYGVLAAVRALHAAGYAPWLAVDEPGTYAARSRVTAGTVAVPDAGSDPEGFIRELAAAAARLSVAAVLPSLETHFLALAGREADFAGIALGTPPREVVERAIDKGLLTEFTSAAGLRTPPTVKAVCGDDEAVDTFGFPAIVKPPRSWIRGVDGVVSRYSSRYVCNKQEAEEALEALPGKEGLVQKYIPGQLTSCSGVSWEGELVCTLYQVSPRIWPVPIGVSSYAKTIAPDAQLECGVGRLLRKISWSGLFQAQFIRTLDGKYYLIDLNPRIYGSLALAVAGGLNLPRIWVDMLLSQRPNVGGYRVGAYFRMEEKEVRALAWMLVDSGGWRTLSGLMPHRGTIHAVFALRDPMPVLTSAMHMFRWVRHYTTL
jgi:predicted ATP-grasp superfamily ATP-dependent carboligase